MALTTSRETNKRIPFYADRKTKSLFELPYITVLPSVYRQIEEHFLFLAADQREDSFLTLYTC